MKYRFLLFFCTLILFFGCDKNDLDRIPNTVVRLEFDPASPLVRLMSPFDHNIFIKKENKPDKFYYSDASATGFGGILVVRSSENDQLYAYDMACPVEVSANTRIFIDEQNLCARCEKCNSTFEIFIGSGAPMSGEANERKFFLKKYVVTPAMNKPNWYVVSR